MRILFLSHYFPPEVNAPANRTFEHCRAWVAAGHEVHVVTGCPSHPLGVPFPGYRRAWYRREESEGIHVHRIWTYLAANRGVVRRTLNYLSFVPTAVFRCLRLGRFDVVIATSPQFFCAVAGWIAGGLKNTPWVFELRDLWPESIVAVGAVKPSFALRLIERLELHLYRDARLVVCLTRAFMDNLEARGIPRTKMAFVPNGVEAAFWTGGDGAGARARHGLAPGHVVASYIGTVGMAHGIETILDAADSLQADRPDVRFLVVGDGASLEALKREAGARGLANVLFTGLVPRAEVRDLMAASDIALVLLRKSEVFDTVIPSKLLEAFAGGKAVVLGIGGEALRLLDQARAGIGIPPEDPTALAAAVVRLASHPEERAALGDAGRRFVLSEFSRDVWARRYLQILEGPSG